MTILFICEEYPPGPCGGIGTYTRSLARALARRGHRVLVAGLYPPGYGGKDQENDEGVEVWRKRLPADRWFGNKDAITGRALLRAMRTTGWMKRQVQKSMASFQDFVQALIERENVDLLEWPDFSVHWSFLRPEDLRPPGCPLLVKCHGTDTYLRSMTGRSYSPSARALEHAHLLRADLRVAVSQYTAAQYQRFYELPEQPAVCYNGVSIPDLRRSRKNEKTVVFSGALSTLKGLDTLMQAWNRVHATHPGARLLVFGKGRPAPFRRLLQPGIRDTVRFVGHVHQEELIRAYSDAALAVFPSRMENFALAPLEAMAAGCPVIYTGRASGPELIRDGHNGLLVDPDEPWALAAAIGRLLTHPEEAEALGRAGRFHVKSALDLASMVSRMEAIYRQMILPAGFRENRAPAPTVY